MLLEFHTSPYDNPFHPVPLSFLPGFELDVKVKTKKKPYNFIVPFDLPVKLNFDLLIVQVQLVEARSNQYVKDIHQCEVIMTSFDSTWGLLENPKHSLPPNTTCRYHLQGRRHERVWISFLKYHAAPSDPATHQISSDCNARLRIWDGRIPSLTTPNVNLYYLVFGLFICALLLSKIILFLSNVKLWF